VLASERAKRRLKLFVTFAGSLIFCVFFIRNIDLDEVLASLRDANYLYIVPALALFAVSLAVRAVRWRYFLLGSYNLGWQDLLPSVLIGYAGNNLLPLRAGELVRAQHLSDRFGIARMQTFGALLMERLFDGAVLSAYLLWGLLVAGSGTAYLGAGVLLAGGAVVGFVVATAAALNPALPSKVASLPLPLLTPGLRHQISGLGGSFLKGFSVLTNPARCAGAALTSVAAWGLELGMYILIARAFDLGASVSAIAFAGAAANVSLSLPLAQGGVGAFEVLATEALVEFDVAENAAAAYSLALHFFLILPVSLVGLAVLWRSTLVENARRTRTASTPAEAPD
jgi:uncharacterized protein (TIRG00374 family)